MKQPVDFRDNEMYYKVNIDSMTTVILIYILNNKTKNYLIKHTK